MVFIKSTANSHFAANILFSDEAALLQECEICTHNLHNWIEEKSEATRMYVSQ